MYQSYCTYTPPHARDTILVCDIDLLVVRHTSKKLLALLNHSFRGVHIAGRKHAEYIKTPTVGAVLKLAEISHYNKVSSTLWQDKS